MRICCSIVRVSYPIVRESYHVFSFISLCIVSVSYVSCICNSLGSHETFHCLYGKNQRCSRSGFRFVKESIIRKYGTKFEREENVGENQNGDCSVFAHAFVLEAISSKVKHFFTVI